MDVNHEPVADRRRGSKRGVRKKTSRLGWLCNPQVLYQRPLMMTLAQERALSTSRATIRLRTSRSVSAKGGWY